MGLGQFAGGVASGIERGQAINTQKKRLQLEDERASREKEDHDYTVSERQRQRSHEDDVGAAWKKWFGEDSNATSTTETLNGPLDARDAAAGTMDGATTQVTTKGQGGGVNPFAEGSEHKLLGAMADVFAADAKYGKVDPAKMKEMIAYRQQFDKDGSLKALQKYTMSGKAEDLQPLAERFGADPSSLKIETKPNKFGMPVPILTGQTKDGQPFETDMSLAASLLGLQDYSKAIDTKHDNDRADRQLEVTDNYYKGRVAAAKAKAAGHGEGYDADLIQKLVDKNESHYSKHSGQIGPDGKPVKDDWANNKTALLAFELADRGMTETQAVRKAREVVDKITTFVDQQDDWSKRSQFGAGDIGYDGVRDSYLKQFMNGKQQPAAASAGAQTAAAAPSDTMAAIRRPAAAPAAQAAPAAAAPARQAPPAAAAAIQRTAAPAQRQSVGSIVGSSGDQTMNRIQAPKIAQVDALASNLDSKRNAIKTAVQSGDQRAIIQATEAAKAAYTQLQTLVMQNFPQDADRIMASVN
jgi:hypothetical protein